ncbi:sugar transferase [Candidatus Sulfidibacterium hydrothermale]|uniref:sugar transferase n=1 Tax=Candidatus Sulfidibacterium hydrothermale TaxID=2875962 RepID=UPI001F0A3677|nr:sugar transferase [Candidatus Sulfidibacterium hydrothermale]UBM61781.1 sugar transferase [Candidatus Sulfidibacterium hydrothermale]
MNKNLQAAKYVFFDWFSALLTWTLFYLYRKVNEDPHIFQHWNAIFDDRKFWLGIIFIPLFWLMLYVMAGSYRRIYRKARLKELGQTFITVLIGVIFLFFVLILDDQVHDYRDYYESFVVLFSLQFGITYFFRLILTTRTVRKVHRGEIGFNTIIIGSNGNAENIYHSIINQEISSGNKFVGFVNVHDRKNFKMSRHLPYLGNYRELNRIVQEKEVEEVIIAIERSEKDTIQRIIIELEEANVIIKVIPMLQDIMFGTVKVDNVFHTPLIEISPDLMPAWQQYLKRIIDIFASSMVLIFLSPLYLFTAIGVKLSSPGPVLFRQERIGFHGKPFYMYKFRSMYVDAEKDGPQLSSKDDPRITPFGKVIRKYRLDEIPQFFTVLKGQMSLVGPRPERQYYIDQIMEKAPHYRLLLKVKPGITSWGQVKYGYASTIDEMVERLKYDLLYLENMSLSMDFKIMIYTVLIILQGRGK